MPFADHLFVGGDSEAKSSSDNRVLARYVFLLDECAVANFRICHILLF